MSRTRGKREAARSGWHTDGDPFSEEGTGKKQKKKGRGKKIALIVLGCVALAAVGAAAWWNIYVKAPDVSGNDRPGVQDKTQTPGVTDGETGDEPDTASGRKEDYFTFLLLGKDTSSGSTDTIILVSYDVANQQVNMMSIPRDTAVNVSWSTKKINSVYSAKESSGGGLENLKKQVAYLTGVTPDFYVIIEWEAVGEIVEAVNGVEFDVPRDMNYDDPYQDLHIHINKGLQTLNGQQAMGVIRYRHDNKRADGSMPGYADGDLGRTRTQQAFLKAMAKKVLQLGNMTKIGEFVKIFMERVETDLKLSDLMWFASKALGMDADTIQSCTMPNEAYTFRGGSYVFANVEELVELVNEQFNPYGRDITADDLQIMVRNKNGSAYVTNGTLLDSRWASAYSSSSGSSSGSSSSGSSGSSSGSSGSSGTEEPALPPAGGGDVGEPGEETATQPGEGGETGTVPEEPGGEEEPTLPAEPTLPEEGSEETGGATAADPGDSTGEADTEPPGWLTGGD